MNRQEQKILLIAGAVLVLGGYLSIRGSAQAEVGSNSSLKSGLLDLTTDDLSYDSWTCPQWQIKKYGTSGVLRLNHPLHRRPRYIGENRHKVMCEGWGGWYYNPPSEEYF